MSVADRLDDSVLLYSHGRFEGALLSVLVSIGATSRRRYPSRAINDRTAFTKFLAEQTVVVTYGGIVNYHVRVPGGECPEYPDGMMPLGDCLYRFVRCHLAHEASIASNVEFFKGERYAQEVQIKDEVIRFSDSFLDGLANAVRFAPENANVFPDILRLTSHSAAEMMFGTRADRHPDYMTRWCESMTRLWGWNPQQSC